MKNINFAPHSPLPAKGERRNKPFIFVSIFLLAILSFVCFYLYISSHKQWQGNFGAKIGSLFNIEKPKKLIKISEGKKNFKVKKHFDRQAEEQEYVGNFDREEIEEESALTEAESKQEGGDKEKTKKLESALKTSYYYIQVCSCVIKQNADKVFRKLDDQGYSPVMEEIVRHIRMHNIYTDDFTNKSEALEFFNRLKNDGFDSVLLPSSGSGYKIRITSCFYMESAKGVIKRLNRLGYKTSIRKEFIPTRMYSVLLGNFESIEEAEAASNRLIKMGYPQPILKLNPKT